MMWVCQAPSGSDSKPPQYKHNGRQEQRQYLQPGVIFVCPVAVPYGVVSNNQNRGRHKSEEDNGSDDTVCDYHRVIAGHVSKAVTHACQVSIK